MSYSVKVDKKVNKYLKNIPKDILNIINGYNSVYYLEDARVKRIKIKIQDCLRRMIGRNKKEIKSKIIFENLGDTWDVKCIISIKGQKDFTIETGLFYIDRETLEVDFSCEKCFPDKISRKGDNFRGIFEYMKYQGDIQNRVNIIKRAHELLKQHGDL
tara:strand:+ start:140 stop:613 length:474 start_codon:yes stop_codon:yes gene_type:complete